MNYDPLSAPDPESWLELDEQERISLVREYHEETGVELPNATLHAAMHAVVENQLALGDDRVGQTLHRLLAEGLDRHDALHAISSVLAEQIWHLRQTDQNEASSEGYYEGLTKLSAASWRAAR